MSLSAWFLAALQLGLPMAVMSWLMFNCKRSFQDVVAFPSIGVFSAHHAAV